MGRCAGSWAGGGSTSRPPPPSRRRNILQHLLFPARPRAGSKALDGSHAVQPTPPAPRRPPERSSRRPAAPRAVTWRGASAAAQALFDNFVQLLLVTLLFSWVIHFPISARACSAVSSGGTYAAASCSTAAAARACRRLAGFHALASSRAVRGSTSSRTCRGAARAGPRLGFGIGIPMSWFASPPAARRRAPRPERPRPHAWPAVARRTAVSLGGVSDSGARLGCLNGR